MDQMGIGLLFLITLYSRGAQAWGTPVFGVTGHSITLPGIQSRDPAESLQWLHNRTVIGTWDRGTSPATLHPDMMLDDITFALTLSNLHPNSNGRYRLDVDHYLSVTYQLTVLDPVSKPNVTKVCNTTNCTLTCMAEQADHAEYAWSDNKGNTEKGHEWTVQRSEQEDMSFTCNVSNAVSWETAVQVITVEQAPVGLIIGGIVAIVAVLFCIYCYKKYKDQAMTGENNEDLEMTASNHNGVHVPEDSTHVVLTETSQQESAGEATESEPLNKEVEDGESPAAEDVCSPCPCLFQNII